MAVDAGGNAFVTGYSIGVNGDYDYATIKYSSSGAPLWVSRYDGPGNSADLAYAIALDPKGNVFVSGYSISAGGDYDYATLKYSNSGVPLWTNRFNGQGNGDDKATAMALDVSGNVFVTGYSINLNGDSDYVTIKYSNAGMPLWTNIYNGPGKGTDEAWGLVVDGGGNALVTGVSLGLSTYDFATIKYSGAGVPLWTNRYSGPGQGFNFARAIAVDINSNVVVTGWSTNNASGSDYAVIKYSGAGVPVWTNRYNGPGNGQDFSTKVAMDTQGNAFVTGYSISTNAEYDYATIGYSSAGVPLSTNRYNGPGNYFDAAEAIAVDSVGNVILTGYSTGAGGNYDFLTIKYAAAIVNPPVYILTNDGKFGFTNGVFGFDYSAPGGSSVVIQVSTNFQAWLPLKTNLAGVGTTYFSDPHSPVGGKRFFRVAISP